MKDRSLKIYFAYSGRDKDGSNPAEQAIQYLTSLGKDSRIHAKAMGHSGGNWKRNKNLVETFLTTIRRSLLANWLYAFLHWSLGEWFIRKKIKWSIETEDWRVEAEKLIEKSDILVFLYSQNSRDEADARNIIWEMETAVLMEPFVESILHSRTRT